MPVDPWAGMNAQQFPEQPNGSFGKLFMRLDKIEERQRDLRSYRPFHGTGFHIGPTGVVIDSSLTIEGSLTLPDKIIGANALAEQLGADGQTVGLLGDSVGTAWADTTVTTINVPAWATRAVVTTTGVAEATDAVTGGLAFCEARMRIGSSTGQSSILPVTTGASVAISNGVVVLTKVVEGVSGSIAAAVQLKASNGAAFGSWKCSTATSVIFVR